jgi:hypothetical protein
MILSNLLVLAMGMAIGSWYRTRQIEKELEEYFEDTLGSGQGSETTDV